MSPPAPKQICFFNTTPFWGGGERWNLVTAQHLRERGHVVHFLTSPDSPLYQRATLEGFPTSEIAVTNRSLVNPFIYRHVKRFLKDRAIDTVVFNGPKDFKAGGLAARAAGIQTRVFQRGLALPLADHLVNRFMFTKVFTHVVANSEATREALLGEFGQPHPFGVEVIYLGVDLDAFDVGAPPASDESATTGSSERSDRPVVLGSVGRLATEKNHAALVDVAKHLHARGLEFEMRIAGTGTLADSLHSQIARLGVGDQVSLVGFVEDIAEFLRDIDVFLLSSKWEGFGLALVEAGAAGKPAVAFNTTSTPEIISQGETGLLAPLDDVAAFADQVQRLIEDDDLRRRMGTAARARIQQRFSVERSIDHFERYLWGSASD